MSWLDTLSNLTKNVGRGALDVFTLGGNELGHKFGGQGYANVMKIPETAFGANFEAGATGSGLMGAGQGLGLIGSGTGATSGAAGMGPVGPMSQAGSTLGSGMSSPMNLAPSAMGSTGAAPGTAVASAPSAPLSLSQRLSMPSMGQQQQQNPQQAQQAFIQKMYQMFPNLKPGSQFGGFNG